MKWQFKHQGFQRQAAEAVTGVFRGQPRLGAVNYRLEPGLGSLAMEQGYRNASLALTEEMMLHNVRQLQLAQHLQPSEVLQRDGNGVPAFSVEMETGTGKTYTYIKTIYELHKHYGWTKYIVVVPSLAIREGVVKSLDTMREHFTQEYGEPLQYFVYDSSRLGNIDRFASDAGIHVMVINTQAFNATGKDARRITTQLEDFGYRRPMDVIAETRPILIIDEPQSVLGTDRNNKTRNGLRQFGPLFTLLYSATHRKDDVYNQVYRLDALDAFNQRLVKKIEVIGVEQVGTTATNGYLYLDAIVLSRKKGEAPQARISFDVAGKKGLRSTTRLVGEGFDVYAASGEIASYRDGYTVERIDGARGCIRMASGIEVHEGQMIGAVTEETLRRVQMRITIEKHLEREHQLYRRGIKVLSLFFIDAVEKYRVYESGSEPYKGRWATIFEEEYAKALDEMMADLFLDEGYRQYLEGIAPGETHQGYFSHDKHGFMIDPKVKRGETSCNDQDAYSLIMRDKERLLSLAEPVRFIFSHSALKEGWDNPNVFQICTLKQSNNETKKRQEVGRGMRLCVNQHGERQDAELLGESVYDVNVLTVIANESYADFSRALQTELAESITSRPALVTTQLFAGKCVTQAGETHTISAGQAAEIMEVLIAAGYVRKQMLTEKYYEDRRNHALQTEDWPCGEEVVRILDEVYNPATLTPEDGRRRVVARFQAERFAKREFQALWQRINSKTYYEVHFETETLVRHAIANLNSSLHVTTIHVALTSGVLENIHSREELTQGHAMRAGQASSVRIDESVNAGVKYDLIGELVLRTGLKRATIAKILGGILPETFSMFRKNPEEFIIHAGNIINAQKALAVIEHISYHTTTLQHTADIFSGQELRGCIGVDAFPSEKSLYDLVVVDSQGTERRFAEELERQQAVEVYTKLPRGFYINTPVGKYNPDWAIVFREDEVKHIYFVAETKGSEAHVQLRIIEHSKIECARRHFESISNRRVRFGVIADYASLLRQVMHEGEKE